MKVGEVTIWVSPLSYDQKVSLSTQTKMVSGHETVDAVKVAFLCLKYSIKEIDGIKNSDGSDYSVALDASGVATDECISELMQMDYAPNIVTACSLLVGKIEAHDVDGVTIDLSGVKQAKKKG